jgi:hypothetical protein
MGYFLEFSFEFGCGIGYQANFCIVSFSLTHTHTYYWNLYKHNVTLGSHGQACIIGTRLVLCQVMLV